MTIWHFGTFWHCRMNSIYLHCLQISNLFALTAKQTRKAHQRLAFLLISKIRTNKLYIFWQCTYMYTDIACTLYAIPSLWCWLFFKRILVPLSFFGKKEECMYKMYSAAFNNIYLYPENIILHISRLKSNKIYYYKFNTTIWRKNHWCSESHW